MRRGARGPVAARPRWPRWPPLRGWSEIWRVELVTSVSLTGQAIEVVEERLFVLMNGDLPQNRVGPPIVKSALIGGRKGSPHSIGAASLVVVGHVPSLTPLAIPSNCPRSPTKGFSHHARYRLIAALIFSTRRSFETEDPADSPSFDV